MREAAQKLNLTRFKFEKLARELNLWNPNQGAKGRSKPRRDGYGKIPTIEILEGKHPEYTTFNLKIRLINDGIKENKCEGIDGLECGISEWNGRQLNCQLDHINGNPKDHRLENLRILCPNCHAQTDTYCGKNKN